MIGRYRVALIGLIVLLAGFVALPGAAHAHKLRLFASVEGAMIVGRVYFSADSPAQGVVVTATLPDGSEVFRGNSGTDGQFRFNAQMRADHLLAAESGDGHAARFTIAAAELPPDLPAPAGSAVPAAAAVPPASPPQAPAAPGAMSAAALAALVEASVARQIRPLREDLDAQAQAARLSDVIGGFGAIFGLGGVAYGLAMRRRKVRAPRGNDGVGSSTA